MAKELEFKFDIKGIQRAFSRFPKRTFRVVKKEFKESINDFHGMFTKLRLSGRKGNVGLKRQGGTLVQNFFAKTSGSSINKLRSIVFFTSRVPYAKVHEDGATITPKRKEWLAIPTQFATRGAKPREHTNTFFTRSKRTGNPVLMQKRGDDVFPIFALVKSVTIPPRLELLIQWNKFKPKFVKNVNKKVAKLIGSFNRGN